MLQNLYSVTHLLLSRHVFPNLSLRCYSCQSFLPSFLPSFLLILHHTEERKSSQIFTRELFFSWPKQARTKKRKIKVSEKGVFFLLLMYTHIINSIPNVVHPSSLALYPPTRYPIPSHTIQFLHENPKPPFSSSSLFLFLERKYKKRETITIYLTSSSIQSNEKPHPHL